MNILQHRSDLILRESLFFGHAMHFPTLKLNIFNRGVYGPLFKGSFILHINIKKPLFSIFAYAYVYKTAITKTNLFR